MGEDNPMTDALAVQIEPTFGTLGTGFSCWQHNGHRGYGGCRNSIFFDDTDDHWEASNRAGMAGWVIGHWDGQAHYACPDDRESLWDPTPLGYFPEVIDAVEAIARTFA